MSNEILTYWKSISELLKWKYYDKNSLILDILYKHKMDFIEFFELSDSGKRELFGLSDESIKAVNDIYPMIPAVAFEIESLNKQGIDIITLNDPDYPANLKNMLKKACTYYFICKREQILTEPTNCSCCWIEGCK